MEKLYSEKESNSKEMIDLSNKYKYLLDTNNPDKHIEYFWYGFKASISNFFAQHNLPDKLPLKEWSKRLNSLQKDKFYMEIEEAIYSYLERFGWYVIMYGSAYNAQIYSTNIKRWNKISNHYNWSNDSEPNIFYVYFNIFYSLIKREKHFKRNEHLRQMLLIVRKYIDYSVYNLYSYKEEEDSNIDNLYILLDQALEYREEYILDQIGKICDIWSYINRIYGLNIKKGTKGKKILLKYNRKK